MSSTSSETSFQKICSRKECVRCVSHTDNCLSSEQDIIFRLSPESRRIHASMKWSETGFVPSFQNTDAVLLKASKRTYEFCKQHR